MKWKRIRVSEPIYEILVDIKKQQNLENGDEAVRWLMQDRMVLLEELDKYHKSLQQQELSQQQQVVSQPVQPVPMPNPVVEEKPPVVVNPQVETSETTKFVPMEKNEASSTPKTSRGDVHVEQDVETKKAKKMKLIHELIDEILEVE